MRVCFNKITNNLSKGHNKYVIVFQRLLFIVIRSCLWIITFIACIPAPIEWLRGIVIESGVDGEMCSYYFRGDAILFGIYIVNLFVWSLPFVKPRKMWKTLRIDIISLLASILLLTSSYLVYAEYCI